jgi:hypothetical protein
VIYQICNRRILHEENHASVVRIEGSFEILDGQMLAVKYPHLRDGIGMKEGFAQ